MKERIIALIAFLLVGFFSAEGSEAMIKNGGIKNVILNTAEEIIDEDYKQYNNEGTLSIDEYGEKKIISRAEPPGPLPPIPN